MKVLDIPSQCTRLLGAFSTSRSHSNVDCSASVWELCMAELQKRCTESSGVHFSPIKIK